MVRYSKPKQTQIVYQFVCEDSKSSQNYIKGFSSYFCLGLETMSSNGTSAKNVVKTAKVKAKFFHDNFIPYKMYCIFDKDDDDISVIKNAIKDCEDKNFKYGYSNPCYEYWLLLHYKRSNKVFTSAKECGTECVKAYNTEKSKEHTLSQLKAEKNIFNIQDFKMALRNAASFSFDDISNTYTNMHILLESILKEKKIEGYEDEAQ